MKRLFDVLTSAFGILLLLPLMILLYLWVVIDSRGGGIYRQVRVGKEGKDFILYKFRTMHRGSDKKQLITVGNNDPRVTQAGYRIRKYKLDELPQLFNVLKGDMSMVGPRPEVRKYVDMYDAEQAKILRVKPGITDYASIAFFNESELLANSSDPEKTYIEQILPEKIRLNQRYLNHTGTFTDLKIIWQTVLRILRK
jgi:lipopolysaccharide/colanic/teichoic acid biosynthesis glycosyltransferase